jgi:prepilin-type N-terminal cleavage/methylation domain-containing protein
MNKIKRGFTLIELLVVIAIIAILAAILFPVFAQAKAAAKATAALSNSKQLDLGIIMYENDYDDTFPMSTIWQTKNDNWELGYSGGPYFSSWGWEIAPYLKSGLLYMDPTTTPLSGTQAVTAFEAFYTQFGYNADFLTPSTVGPAPDYPPVIKPAIATSAADPANTISLASKWNSSDNHTGYLLYTGANDPTVPGSGGNFDQYIAESPVCGPLANYCLTDWGRGTAYDVTGTGNLLQYALPITDGRYTAGVAYRVAGHTTTAFVDGHSKALPYQSLTAGTNFNINAAQGTAGGDGGVVVTSAAKYLWSVSKTCADFGGGSTTAAPLPNCSP